MVGRKGLEPSHSKILVPKTNASTNSAIAPQIMWFLYIIETICPMTIDEKITIYLSKFKLILKIMIISPCISICKTDPSTGYCYGCGRNNEEKRTWKLEDTTSEWKKNNLEDIKKRLSGWQLESFNESYKYKINNGMSLFRKNIIKE